VPFRLLAFKIKTYELAIFHFLAKKGLNWPKTAKKAPNDRIFYQFSGWPKNEKTAFFGPI
jgi:hypothetical protein